MNEWQIAGIICVCVFLLNISLAIGSEIFQRLWAWIDDSKHNSLNWYLDKINYWKSEWKYPVYLRKTEEPFGYAKNKEYSGCGS